MSLNLEYRNPNSWPTISKSFPLRQRQRLAKLKKVGFVAADPRNVGILSRLGVLDVSV